PQLYASASPLEAVRDRLKTVDLKQRQSRPLAAPLAQGGRSAAIASHHPTTTLVAAACLYDGGGRLCSRSSSPTLRLRAIRSMIAMATRAFLENPTTSMLNAPATSNRPLTIIAQTCSQREPPY